MTSYLGYALLIIGIGIIAFSIIIGYGIYISVSNSANSINVPDIKVNPNSTIATAVGSPIANLSQNVSVLVSKSVYTGLEITVLFFFAAAGYKISALGILMLNEDKKSKKKGKDKETEGEDED